MVHFLHHLNQSFAMLFLLKLSVKIFGGEITFILKNAHSHVYVLHQKLQLKMKSIINI